MAAASITYLDYMIIMASSEQEKKTAMHQVYSRLNYLGIQYTSQKYCPPSKYIGTWAALILFLEYNQNLYNRVSWSKWYNRTKIISYWQICLQGHYGTDPLAMDHNKIERDIGFLINMYCVYTMMVTYLKGFCLTIYSWILGRDGEGLRYTRANLLPRLYV